MRQANNKLKSASLSRNLFVLKTKKNVHIAKCEVPSFIWQTGETPFFIYKEKKMIYIKEGDIQGRMPIQHSANDVREETIPTSGNKLPKTYSTRAIILAWDPIKTLSPKFCLTHTSQKLVFLIHKPPQPFTKKGLIKCDQVSNA